MASATSYLQSDKQGPGGSNGGHKPFGERQDQGGTHLILAAASSLE